MGYISIPTGKIKNLVESKRVGWVKRVESRQKCNFNAYYPLNHLFKHLEYYYSDNYFQ